MANMLANGMAWLNAQMKASAATTMTYRREGSNIDLDVTIGAVRVSPLTVLAGVVADRDTSQPSPKHTDHPFFFNAEDLILDGALTEPKEGDTLEITVDSATTVYQLMAPMDGGRMWQYVNGHETGSAARIKWNGRLKVLY